MVRKSSGNSGIELIFSLIGVVFIIIGYSICFLEKVSKYGLWKQFWQTTIPLILFNIVGYYLYPQYEKISIFLYGLSWISFIVYWSCMIYDKEHEERQEIISQIGVETANCPYCGISLSKFPYRKTRCKNCGNFMYVRTRPIDNKRILVREDNIEELESQWSKKRGRRNIPVIDGTDEADKVVRHMVNDYPTMVIYKELKAIEEENRFPICKYIWDNWVYHNPEKGLIKQYSQYDKNLLKEITIIENSRFNTYFKKQEFAERADKTQRLIELGWLPSEKFGVAKGICTINTMIDVFNWYISRYEELGELPPNYIEMPFHFTPFSLDTPDYKIYLFRNKDFHLVTTEELKEFCKKNNYGYPYKD